MVPDYIEIGKRIRNARLKAKLSQQKLADLANFSLTHIHNIENGNAKLSLPALLSIANALSVSADQLLCDNLIECKEPYLNEIQELLSQCDSYQLRVIETTIKALKESLDKGEELLKNNRY